MEPCCTAHMGPIWVPIWDPYRLLAGITPEVFVVEASCLQF